ncbi:LacI family DNA-binding transcriptional regulator [Cellulomonas denverensis]|uniref:LacI family transcriptional regulator n=1 Tax=Cellulomonas denverensis TaxID=264297 RepID=A0A7X6QZR4_9CELL|nr:LacI family DNA-binding transcriptional regulator [Cellulomonas denverensis]NKY23410.1 LacI family transcriptional regulator [Cellulomonas denverensis]GIG25109.1 LacI family transcriptional regulator [Cellulomonas denverensis]
MQTPTIRDVAARAGVSVATVSRVLSEHPSTSAASRQKVLSAAADLGFRPNAQARSLRRTRTNTIGVLVSDVRNPFFAEIAHTVEQTALSHEMATLLCNADESTEQQDHCLDLLVSQRVDGMIVTPQGDGSGSLREVLSLGLPVVFVDRTIDGVEVPSVTSDNRTGIVEAVQHLAGLGHRRIGYVAGPQVTSTGRERLAAYREAVADAGLDTDPGLVFEGDFRSASGVAGARALLALPDPPTAVLAADSLMTFGVLLECRDRGLRIGADLSVIGYDDIESFGLVSPPLTVIAHDPSRMGALAVDMIRDLLAGEPVTSAVLTSSLVLRGSTGPAGGTR